MEFRLEVVIVDLVSNFSRQCEEAAQLFWCIHAGPVSTRKETVSCHFSFVVSKLKVSGGKSVGDDGC